MLKRIVLLMVLAAVIGLSLNTESYLNAADAEPRNYFVSPSDFTVDSAIGGNWEPAATVIAQRSDSATTMLEVSGVAVMDPGERLYVGFGNDSLNRVDEATGGTTGQTHTNLDTFLIEAPATGRGIKMRIPFTFKYALTTKDAGSTDTFYVNMAVGGTAVPEKVAIEDLIFHVEVAAFDSLN